jgi:hypothetical protein
MFAELLESVLSASLGSDCRREFRGIEACVAPGYIGVVDHVRDAPILEGAQQACGNTIRHRCVENEVLLTQSQKVKLKRNPFGFEMEALRIPAPQGLQVWARYLREAIAPAFGLTFSQAIWNAGFVVQDPEVFLLVTLAKEDMNSEHRYVDHFVSDHEFAWQSQNRTTRASKHGRILSDHLAQGKRVHLFVRPTKKTGSKPTSFIYCGEVDFVSWEGDAPISVKWRLRDAVPPSLHGVLGVPS